MKIDPIIQFMKQVQGKVGSSIYAPLQGQTNPQHLAFLRQLEKERKAGESLSIPLKDLNVVVFDLETTGFYPDQGDEIISIGAIKVKGDIIQHNETYYSLVRSERKLSTEIIELTGITDDNLKEAPELQQVLIEFYDFVRGDVLVAHHSNHEKNFLQHTNRKLFRSQFNHRIVDTSFLLKIAEPTINLVRLEECCEHCGIPVVERHHALGDAKLTAQLWSLYLNKIQNLGYNTLNDLYVGLSNKF
ncbi:exonuclease domain-containing protein [Pseudalkalibacillus salsuginis]|uniref:exonuclease domain-containing protein n=1 Tax=Pseudalkalibacillus salsuginis TaxID=2910972 RepID=UPI001F160934|nr:exonuclease domain-containing protein [Pseudalkalibacillus salsuginis]MCF6408938.1 3'-5' exoribonuclease [Pseudalkalibacillus salsuginis]